MKWFHAEGNRGTIPWPKPAEADDLLAFGLLRRSAVKAESKSTFTPGPTPNTVRTADGRILTAPEGWVLLPPGDAALTRRLKAAGDH